jgi:hypothetical protein
VGEAGKPWQGILAAVPIAVIALTLDHSEASHNNYENQEYPPGTSRCFVLQLTVAVQPPISPFSMIKSKVVF